MHNDIFCKVHHRRMQMPRQSLASRVRALAALSEHAAAQALSEKRRAAANVRWEKQRLRRAAAAATEPELFEDLGGSQAAPDRRPVLPATQQPLVPAVTVSPGHLVSDPLSTAVAVAKEAAPEAIGLLLDIMRGDRFAPSARLKAIEMVCEIAGLGEHPIYAERDVLELDGTQLDAFIAAANAELCRIRRDSTSVT